MYTAVEANRGAATNASTSSSSREGRLTQQLRRVTQEKETLIQVCEGIDIHYLDADMVV